MGDRLCAQYSARTNVKADKLDRYDLFVFLFVSCEAMAKNTRTSDIGQTNTTVKIAKTVKYGKCRVGCHGRIPIN
jgi:hypothetical protein